MNPTAQLLHAPVAALADDGAEASRVAGAVLVSWRAIDAALAPIVGRGGLSALYRRSVKLAQAEHPWLPEPPLGEAPDPFTDLHVALCERPTADAAAAHRSMLHSFCAVLETLIGASLTERILLPVQEAPPSSGAAAGNTPS